MKRRLLICFLGILVSSSLFAQVDTLNYYLQVGLENNLALQQKQASYEKSMLAVKEARRMFYPGISFNARYSIADGGRVIEFPVGDLLNPVYSTLNALTMSDYFPQIENREFTVLRSREHETKLQLIQPIFNTGLHYNYKIRSELSQASRVDVDRFKRYLVAEIKKAYFNYLQTLRMEELAFETRELLEENVRVSNKLFENQKVTSDVVYRSQAELSNIDQLIAEVEKNRKVARSYLNFLLNRPLETPLYDPREVQDTVIVSDLELAKDHALDWREELDLLDHYLDASAYNLKIIRSQNYPMLLAAVDYGFQGKKYRFTADDDFVIASFVLKWDIFSGFQNRARIKQAVVETELLKQQKEEAEQQIRLEVTQAYYDLKAAVQSIRSSGMECIHARKAFRLVDRKYGEGMASLIEYMDARTAMTSAEINRIISRFDLQVKLAEYERTTASFDFSIVH
jgi:outer membrane protein